MNREQFQALLIDDTPNGLVWAKKLIVYAAGKLPDEFKSISAAVEFIDFVTKGDNSAELQRQIDDLYQYYSEQKEVIIGEVVSRLISILGKSQDAKGLAFIKAGACLEICKNMSTKSEYGQSNDPIIERDKCIEIISKYPFNRPVHFELMKVTQELEDNQLIYIHSDASSIDGIRSIGPKEYFFCLTDAILQSWDPEVDSKAFILAAENETMVSIPKMDKKLGWGPRRINSTIAWLDLARMIDNDRQLGGPYEYCLDWLILNARAFLYVDQS